MATRRKGSSYVYDLSKTDDLYENPKNVKLHSSKHFFVKGSNGVMLNKIPPKVVSISVLDDNLNEICSRRRSLYYFDEQDVSKMVLVELENGEYEEFIYSPEAKDFIRRKSQLFDV